MSPALTALYAAVLAVIYIAMSFHVILTRAKTDVMVGDGGNMQLLVAIRRHGNMAEYVPFALLMMGLAESLGLSSVWLHVCGLSLLAGRLVHPLGVRVENSPLAPRVFGILATMLAMLIPAIGIFFIAL